MPKVATRVDVDVLMARLVEDPPDDDVDGRILAAASGALARSGLAGLEVDEVAQRSGVGRSTIYRRFTDRNLLIAATLAHDARRFLGALAVAVEELDDLEDQVVAAFVAGLRVAQRTGLGSMVRGEPLLLQLLTVDSGPLLTAATEQLVALAVLHDPTVDRDVAAGAAEMLVRLAISFVVAPETSLRLDDDEIENTVRRHVAPLVNAG